ncbi:MAG: response regulator [Balneolaceae bacterium]
MEENKHKNVVIVEDDPLQANVMTMLLNSLDYDVVGVAETGEEAIKLVVDLKPGLVLMDIMLKGELDGIEAAKKILSGSGSDISLIYITGNSDSFHRRRADKTNYVDYLVKPITKKNLTDALAKCKT